MARSVIAVALFAAVAAATASPPFSSAAATKSLRKNILRRPALATAFALPLLVGAVGKTSSQSAVRPDFRCGGTATFASSELTRAASVALSLSSSSASGSGGDGEDKKKKSRGVYARPSAAIERGSGFFIPGLEGSRVRLLFGIVVLILTYVNHVTSAMIGGVSSDAQSLSETVAVLYGLLLLLQAAVEFGKELGFGFGIDDVAATSADGGNAVLTTAGTAVTTASMDQFVSSSLAASDRAAGAVQWAAATFIALTPATHVLLVGMEGDGGSPEVWYSLGDFAFSVREASEADGVLAAVETAFASKGGRISIPSDHPASAVLLPEESRRCVLLQRVGSKTGGGKGGRLCLMIGSDKLLPSFTKNDLRWLGQLGKHVEQSMIQDKMSGS